MTGNDGTATAAMHEQMPFSGLLGAEVEAASPAEVVVRATWAPERCTAGGALHGGFLMAVADATGALCAALNLPSGSITTTIESKTNFFRPVTDGDVVARAEPVHVGRRTIVIQTDVVRGDGKLVTRTVQTQAVIGL